MPRVLSIDVMGGDEGPSTCLSAVRVFHDQNPQVKFIIHGCKDAVKPWIKAGDKDFMDFRFSRSSIQVGERGSTMLSNADGSSLMNAIQSVQDGEAHGVMSMGDTGAIALLSQLVLGKIDGVRRCSLIACIPISSTKQIVLLDVGSNLERAAGYLVSNSIMGSIVHGALLKDPEANDQNKKSETRLALLNVGEEESKGGESLLDANKALKKLQNAGQLPFQYMGFTEPQEMIKGNVDVVVADGFSGNVIIKTLESSYLIFKNAMKERLERFDLLRRFLFIGFIKLFLKKIVISLSPKNFNGALLGGVNGIVVKIHGYSKKESIVSGIGITLKFVDYSMIEKISEKIKLVNKE